MTFAVARSSTVAGLMLPIAVDTASAPHVVVAEVGITVPAAPGMLLDVTSKVQVANYTTYLTMVAGFVQAVSDSGRVYKLSTAMGENVEPRPDRKYYCDIQLGKFLVPSAGVWTLQHILYAASSAAVEGDNIDVKFADIQVLV